MGKYCCESRERKRQCLPYWIIMLVIGIPNFVIGKQFKNASQEICKISTATRTVCKIEKKKCGTNSNGEKTCIKYKEDGWRYAYEATTPKCGSELLKPRLYEDFCTRNGIQSKSVNSTETCYVNKCSTKVYIYKNLKKISSLGTGLLVGGIISCVMFFVALIVLKFYFVK